MPGNHPVRSSVRPARWSRRILVGLMVAGLALSCREEESRPAEEEGVSRQDEETLRWLHPDNPRRDARCETDVFMDVVHPRFGDRIADIGAGSGYFTFKFARKVGIGGTVYATESKGKLVGIMRKYAAAHGFENVVVLQVGEEEPGLSDAVDKVALFNLHTFCEHKKTEDFFRALSRAVAPSGKVVFFTDSDRYSPEISRTCQLSIYEMINAVSGAFWVDRRIGLGNACKPHTNPTTSPYMLVLRPLP